MKLSARLCWKANAFINFSQSFNSFFKKRKIGLSRSSLKKYAYYGMKLKLIEQDLLRFSTWEQRDSEASCDKKKPTQLRPSEPRRRDRSGMAHCQLMTNRSLERSYRLESSGLMSAVELLNCSDSSSSKYHLARFTYASIELAEGVVRSERYDLFVWNHRAIFAHLRR